MRLRLTVHLCLVSVALAVGLPTPAPARPLRGDAHAVSGQRSVRTGEVTGADWSAGSRRAVVLWTATEAVGFPISRLSVRSRATDGAGRPQGPVQLVSSPDATAQDGVVAVARGGRRALATWNEGAWPARGDGFRQMARPLDPGSGAPTGPAVEVADDGGVGVPAIVPWGRGFLTSYAGGSPEQGFDSRLQRLRADGRPEGPPAVLARGSGNRVPLTDLAPSRSGRRLAILTRSAGEPPRLRVRILGAGALRRSHDVGDDRLADVAALPRRSGWLTAWERPTGGPDSHLVLRRLDERGRLGRRVRVPRSSHAPSRAGLAFGRRAGLLAWIHTDGCDQEVRGLALRPSGRPAERRPTQLTATGGPGCNRMNRIASATAQIIRPSGPARFLLAWTAVTAGERQVVAASVRDRR